MGAGCAVSESGASAADIPIPFHDTVGLRKLTFALELVEVRSGYILIFKLSDGDKRNARWTFYPPCDCGSSRNATGALSGLLKNCGALSEYFLTKPIHPRRNAIDCPSKT